MNHGHFIVITGPMFSGKSSYLNSRLRRAEIAGQKTMFFRPKKDTREQTTHDGEAMDAEFAKDIHKALAVARNSGVRYVGIDEVQFFDVHTRDIKAIVDFVYHGGTVLVAGLDLDQEGHMFRPTMRLMPYAHDVIKLKAVCTRCTGDATHSQWTSDEEYNEKTRVGGLDKYEPRCLSCFVPYEHRRRMEVGE